ncbi:phosphatidylglycerophosphatase A [Stappia sp.]|uniref:phosphatidylglycerophosphatase A family protein n=1 Tax=Stappia sp. TaxID=1870903 RepID=UPI0032D8FB90
MARLARLLALSFGAGLSPVWPGTVGAALGLPLAAALLPLQLPVQIAALALVFAVGVWASAVVARDTGEEDPQIVVIDETFGAAAVLIALPEHPVWWIAGFIAFRAFDILKPWPVDWVQDRVKGGLGIMADDAAAAAYAIALLGPLPAALAFLF